MSLRRSYSRVEEDPIEIKHRRAQFLINKVLEKAESRRRRYFPKVVLRRSKIKIGARLRSMTKSLRRTISAAKSRICVHGKVVKQLNLCKAKSRVCLHGKVVKQLNLWKRAVCGRDDVLALAPLLG